MNKNLITFENKIIKVLLKNVYKKIDVEITYQFVNPYQLITKELKILKNTKHEISSSDLRNLNYYSLRKKGILLINNLVNIDRKYFNKKTNNMSYLSIPEKKLENNDNPPKLIVEFFDNQKNIKNINCYSNDGGSWGQPNLVFEKNILYINFESKFLPRRGRINCSLNDNGKWRWFGTQFVIVEKLN